MKDENKTKAQLISELAELRQRVAELEAIEAERVQTEEILRQSKLRFRSLIEQTTDAVFCYEYDPPIPMNLPIGEQVKELYRGVLMECNDVCARSYGFTRAEQVIGKKLTELFGTTPGSLDRLFTALIQGDYHIIDGLGTEMLEDGTKRYYLNNGHAVVEDGMLKRVWGTFRDITDQVRAEEALRNSQEQLELITNKIPALLAYVDSELRYLYVNRAYADWYGFFKEEIVGKYVGDVLSAESYQGAAKHIEAVLRGQELSYENIAYDTEGQLRAVRATYVPDFDENGRVKAFLGLVEDITERKQAEEALRESEERYRRLMEISPDGIVVHSEGKIILANTASAEIVGAEDPDKLLGRSAMEFVHPDFRGIAARRIQQALKEGGKVPRIEEKFIRFDGSIVDVEVSAAAFTYREKPAMLTVIRDITERKRAEEALRREHALAQALEKATASLTATLDPDQVLDRILEQVGRVVPNDATNIMLVEETRRARIVRWRGYERFGAEAFASTAVFDLDQMRNLRLMADTGEPMIIPDTASYPGWVPMPEQAWLRSHAGAPIHVRGEVIGFLNVDSTIPGFFTQAHAEPLRAFASHAAAALENARLYEAERERRHVAETLRQASTVFNSTLELDRVLELILAQLRQVIPYDSASVQRLADKEEHLEIVACQGFEKPDKVMGLVFPLNSKFPNHRVITTRASLAIEDIVQDYPHFQDEADIFESDRIRSWLGVPLIVKDKVIGMIALDRVDVRPYTAEESQLAMAFANQAAVAIENAQLYEAAQQEIAERKQAEERIRAALQEKDVLLREIHHRVKNNLQLVCALLDLQIYADESEPVRELLQTSRDRVRSMSYIHEQLTHTQNLAQIDMQAYVQELVSSLRIAYGVHAITFEIDVVDVTLPFDLVSPCGLLINELVSNAIKHAFPTGQDGEVRVALRLLPQDGNRVELTVSDNGISLPANVDPTNPKTLGLTLVDLLTRQLKGTLELDRSEGTVFRITFEVPELEQ